MKKLIFPLICCSLLCFGLITTIYPLEFTHAEQGAPSYAKWGRLAMIKVKEKYPGANIVDYLHVGGKKGIDTTTETFKLWLEAPQKEFGVFIDITFNNNTEQIISVKYREVTS